MRLKSLIIFVGMVFLTGVSGANPYLWTIKEVDDSARFYSRVMILGKIEKKVRMGYFIISDGTSKIMLSMIDIEDRPEPGDLIAVVGKYENSNISNKYGEEINVFEWTDGSDEAAIEKMRKKHRPRKPPKKEIKKEPKKEATPPEKKVNFKDRLQKLDGLKEEGLISDQEYQQQRQRILNEL